MNEELRKKLTSRETAFGLWVTSEAPAITEVVGTLGLHWVCLDMEHGYLDYRDIAGHLTAARGSGLSVFVRPPTQDLEPTKRALDLGAHGLIIPLVDNAEELQKVHKHAFYPPHGRRGIGGERSVTWGLNLEAYVRSANDEIMIVPMIETQTAYENLDAILDTPRVEAVFLGPGDLSASRGAIGEWEGPGVAEINLDIRRRAAAKEIAAGIVARDTNDAKSRRDQGFGMVSLGSDIGLMIRQIRQMARDLGGSPIDHRWF
ncbi:HpcH/HpaI aldolase family protein [Kribbella kalugense]|uniref:2-dehydro-3-deoxyglucarate aldolase/4-hydroxy-2-oxoheptanedioate aldolase n=1 Tax=Kribbella kalugense TaxID=2512221 RepID=A0A4R8A1C5_9ACTN|nr:aldolase/citrate lyase family protein [Kribbella kalugense]TDW24303.1 2-dehydro-3-deoxyglucarate aldolase/4-hydroxy-2-oxoheptanedioate aldolase [Kribbella kalugense]